MARKKTPEFKWGPLSTKQLQVLTWWRKGSAFADYNGIIADGAIRSGKTVSMEFSFVEWAMETFDGHNFGICGKTIESLRRNVIKTLVRQLRARGYKAHEKRSENMLVVSRGGKTNDFYLFGGKDESSQDLIQGIHYVVEQAGVIAEQVQEIIIAGNTTMIHLLMGYDCKSLGEYPFTPVNIEPIESNYREIFEDDFLSARVRIVPGISTFVGGDITAGLYSCSMDEQDTYSLLIDLGTNGEMALGNKDKMIVTSTAAGPAFEGGNITWGVGSLEGAIAGVKIEDGKAQVRTIGDKAPIGICGTGVIETVAELIRAELVDETGCLDDDYFDDGFPLAVTENGEEIVFTQQDVREIQLAKAAVRAGIETLFLRYGIEKEQVAHVYLAGGFGFKLDCRKAIEIGMIPAEFADKVEAVGNSSLGGAIKSLLNQNGWQRMAAIGRKSQEINLSADKDFNQFYMDCMYLERDEAV